MSLLAAPCLYIGPGIGLGTVVLVLLVLLLVVVSFGLILWIPIRRAFRRLFGKRPQ